MHDRFPNPHKARLAASETVANVLATAAGVSALKANGNRIAVWMSLVAAATLSAVQYVAICVLENGTFRALAAVAAGTPNVHLSIDQFGQAIQRELFVVAPDVNTTVSVGFIQVTDDQSN